MSLGVNPNSGTSVSGLGNRGNGEFLDTNSSTNLNAMKAFLKNSGKIANNSNNTIQNIFNSADTNNSGALEENEISVFLSQWNMNSVYSSNDVMGAVDLSGDGKVELNEILSYAASMGVELDGNNTLGQALGKVAGLGGGIGSLLGSISNLFNTNGSEATNQNNDNSGSSSNENSSVMGGFSNNTINSLLGGIVSNLLGSNNSNGGTLFGAISSLFNNNVTNSSENISTQENESGSEGNDNITEDTEQ